MTEMPATALAVHFGPHHPEALIAMLPHSTFLQRLVKAWPARARLELGIGVKQWGSTAGARVDAHRVMVDVLAGVGTFGSLLPQHPELFIRKAFSPIGIGDLHPILSRGKGRRVDRARRAGHRFGSMATPASSENQKGDRKQTMGAEGTEGASHTPSLCATAGFVTQSSKRFREPFLQQDVGQ